MGAGNPGKSSNFIVALSGTSITGNSCLVIKFC